MGMEDQRMEPKSGGQFYLVTIQETEINEKGQEKKIKTYQLVDAVSPTEVEKKVGKEMEGSVLEWEIVSIVVSKINAVY